jgi:hypothetical protein
VEPVAKGGRLGAERLTDQSVCSIVQAYAERIGLKAADFGRGARHPAAITLVPVATTLMGRAPAPMMPILGSHEQRRKAGCEVRNLFASGQPDVPVSCRWDCISRPRTKDLGTHPPRSPRYGSRAWDWCKRPAAATRVCH